MSLKVNFRGNKVQLDAKDFDSLQSEISARFGVKPQAQKLVAKGGVRVYSNDTLEKVRGQVLHLIGATIDELEAVERAEKEKDLASRHVKNDMDIDYDLLLEERKSNTKNKMRQARLQDANSTPYRFNEVRVLEQFRDKEKAREILEDLATDPGFLAVLRKNKWTVGALTEMYPDGKVGVDPVCVLGVNINKGQEISLRLRTDDLKGFRKRAVIRETLCHELSHMRWSDHDSNFYMLMREIQGDVVQLDWRQGNGRALGGRDFAGHRHVLQDANNQMQSSQSSSPQRLGGQVDSRLSKRSQLASAVAARLSQGSDQSEDVEQQAEDLTPPSPPQTFPSETGRTDEKATTTCSCSHEAKEDQPQATESGPKSESPVSSSPQCEREDMPLPPPEAQEAVRTAVGRLVERNHPSSTAQALELLAKIVGNVLNHPENDKFRKLRLSNAKVKHLVSSVLEGRNVLVASGWTITEDAVVFLDISPQALGLCNFALDSLNEAASIAAALLVTNS